MGFVPCSAKKNGSGRNQTIWRRWTELTDAPKPEFGRFRDSKPFINLSMIGRFFATVPTRVFLFFWREAKILLKRVKFAILFLKVIGGSVDFGLMMKRTMEVFCGDRTLSPS